MTTVGEGYDPALAQHDIEIQFSRKALIQLERKIVESRTFRIQIIGTHHSRVPPRIASSNPAPLKNGDISDSMILG
jgi:hypothetical protein